MVDRSIAPAFTAPKKFTLPELEIIQLKNGSRFFALQAGDQPVLKLEFIFKAGVRCEVKPGIAFFTSKMLTEGTSKFSSKTISSAFDQYGAFIEIHPGFDYATLSIHIPTSHLHQIEDVLKEILFQPTFPTNELELLKKIQQQQVKVNEQKNSFVASRLFRSKLYPHSPYGHVMDEQTIASIDQADLIDFFNQRMKGKFDIFLTGQFESSLIAKITALIEGSLEKKQDFPTVQSIEETYFQESIEKKDSLQAAIYIGKRCINRKDKNYPALLLLNEVFGGYFGSRLMQNIREEKGLTYSIYSHIASMKDEAYFIISTDVKKENKDQALEEINNEITLIKDQLIELEELNQAKNHLKGSILNTLTNPFAISEKLKNIYIYELGEDFYDHLFDQIDILQPQDLLEISNTSLFSSPLSSVVVG